MTTFALAAAALAVAPSTAFASYPEGSLGGPAQVAPAAPGAAIWPWVTLAVALAAGLVVLVSVVWCRRSAWSSRRAGNATAAAAN